MRLRVNKEDRSHGRPAQDMEKQRATNPTEEKTCIIWPIMSMLYNSVQIQGCTWIYIKSLQNMINTFARWC